MTPATGRSGSISGTVTLVFSKDGFTSLTKTVKVRSGSTVSTDVALQPARC
ncbi:PEGA domain-containing protein [Micromonospora phytophila]|uniref:PEGA domain-containing protein n=1 Tax=Micromonospora phytophila TaxID=709888 RepID=UPI003556B441